MVLTVVQSLLFCEPTASLDLWRTPFETSSHQCPHLHDVSESYFLQDIGLDLERTSSVSSHSLNGFNGNANLASHWTTHEGRLSE